MDEQTKNELFMKLGSIEAKCDALTADSRAQWDKNEKLDERLRTQESRHSNLAAKVSLAVSVTVALVVEGLKKGISGGT